MTELRRGVYRQTSTQHKSGSKMNRKSQCQGGGEDVTHILVFGGRIM